ncbi:site-specific integrase [Neobacillus notoginsengisoli]|uniref:Site-specific integrase n=1 Tax=Neobacillus notoginsengisoli TaxID=1578198 RepID=A0A417YFG7_9BACI|nr:site-specific integrase [Neobacillus notoginsengisoli]RHW31509.1 site-specific integrase [Neobacillus notoginsengisoli]
MAKFKQRGKTWTYYVYVGINPLTKKRIEVSKGGFKTKRDAQAAARLVELEKENGTLILESKITFGQFAHDWLKTYSRSGVKKSTVRAREKEMKHFIKVWWLYQIGLITKKMYQERMLDLSEKYSQNYMDGIAATGRMIFGHAFELGIIKVNPTEGFRLPKKQLTVEELENQEEDITFLEKEELSQFLKLSATEGLEMDLEVFTTLSYSGVRIGELLAFKWADFDEKKGTLRITKTLYNPNNNIEQYELLTPKTKGSVRTIRIDDFLVKLLRKHKIRQKEIQLKNKPIYQDEGFIFARDDGRPQLRKVIETRLKRLLKKAGITKNITPHSFRHTHTSLLIEAGVGIKEIQQRLGHTDINTTMNIYAHMTANMEEKASQQFSKLMKDLLL